jgi:predicted porin
MTFIARRSPLAAVALLAIAGSTLSTAALAQATEFNWYGRLDLALENNSNGTVTRTAVQNFSSRLGIRGEHKLNDALSGVFQIETGVAPDDTAQSKTLASRNSFVGLKSKVGGTLILGTHDMPLKTLGGGAYSLWAEGDLEEVIVHGKASRVAIGNANFDNVHTRKTNVLLYTSPKFFNTVGKLAFSPDEGKAAAAAGVPEYAKNMWGASVEYNDGLFNGGLAAQQQANFIAPTATVSGSSMKAVKAVFGVKWQTLTAGIEASRLDNSRGKKTTNLLLTSAYGLDAFTFKASIGRSSESSDGANDGVKAFALEADYAFDKTLTLYTYYSRLTNAVNAKGSFAAADNFPAVVKAGDDPRAFGLGVRYNF